MELPSAAETLSAFLEKQAACSKIARFISVGSGGWNLVQQLRKTSNLRLNGIVGKPTNSGRIPHLPCEYRFVGLVNVPQLERSQADGVSTEARRESDECPPI
jgi:hypothetical protein